MTGLRPLTIALFLTGLLLADVWLGGAFLMREVLTEKGPEPPSDWTAEWLLQPNRMVREMLHPTTAAGRQAAGQLWFLHLAGAAGLALWITRKPGHHRRPEAASHYGSHGSARWAAPGELTRRLPGAGPGLILGKVGRRLLILPPHPHQAHNQLVAVFGGSGSRKTRSFVLPNLLWERHASLVVVDPKGENYATAAALLKARGYEVRVLNFLSMAHSDRWNPLDSVHSVTDAADLAVNVVANTDNPHRQRGDPFWEMAEQSFLTALVLYVKQHRPPAEQHMASVLELGGEPAPDDLDFLFETLPPGAPARKFYRSFLRADAKVRAGVLAGLGSRLQLWNSDAVAELTAVSDFNLAGLGSKQRPMALFLIIPDAKLTYAPVLALFWQQVFQVLYSEADRQGGRLARPVRCRMDELCNCGYIPEFEKKLSTMRSRGLSVELVVQTLDQLKNRYPRTWSELLGNCDTWLYLGGNDLETAQYISAKLGATTLQVHGHGTSEGTRTSSRSLSVSYTHRPLLTPDECMRLDPGEAVLLQKGCFPARVRKVDYLELPVARAIRPLRHHERKAPARGPVPLLPVEELLNQLRPPPAEPQGEPARAAAQAPDSKTAGGAGQPAPGPSTATQYMDQGDDQSEGG